MAEKLDLAERRKLKRESTGSTAGPKSSVGGASIEDLLAALRDQQVDFEAELGHQRQEFSDAIEDLKNSFEQQRRELESLKSGVDRSSGRLFTKDTAHTSVHSERHEAIRPFKPMKPMRSEPGTGCFFEFVERGMAYYNFSASMWDAGILCFFREISIGNKVVLFLGILLNYFLQGFLLLVVRFNLCTSPFPEEKIEEMLAWRVNKGHSHDHFDQFDGMSMIQKLCSRELWGFEQEEYEQIYSYLYYPIPGYMLSLLAIVLWVLTTIGEYRSGAEQGLALLALPIIQPGERCIVEDHGSLKIVGIHRREKIAAILLLVIPRIIVVGMISVVGCQFLAQTPALHDIMLNAVGLAFVLDVDEHLYNMLCTQRIRSVMEHMKPLPCSKRYTKTYCSLQLKDIIRYVFTIGVMLTAYYLYLVPFYDNLEGAASALCGGLQDFSYKGGTEQQNTIWLQNSTNPDGSEWRTACYAADAKTYLPRFYGKDTKINSSLLGGTLKEPIDFAPIRSKVILNYAFKGCDRPRHMLMPQGESPPSIDGEHMEMQRKCVKIPKALMKLLPKDVTFGAPDPPRCTHFKPEHGLAACHPPPDGEACVWSWQSEVCEGYPPGDLSRRACSNNTDPTREMVAESCNVWLSFRTPNPHYHCRALECSGEKLTCFWLLANISMKTNPRIPFRPRVMHQALRGALKGMTGLKNENVVIAEPANSSSSVNMSFGLLKLPPNFLPHEVLTTDLDRKLLTELKRWHAEVNQTVLALRVFDARVLKESELQARVRRYFKELAGDYSESGV